jgi:TetR/AcrR family transcriptional repressor of nem operon
MSDVAAAIMDAAERRMRRGGFNGFSFREIAADVGVKSSSVHYHFPTKDDLAAAVVKRYTAETAELIERELGKENNPIKVWVKAFRGTLHSQDRMCPCAVLGASSQDLPPEVAAEVKRFFKMCHDKLVEEGLPPDEASQLLSTITGALVVANAVNDFSVYDNATREFTRSRKSAPVKAAARRLK